MKTNTTIRVMMIALCAHLLYTNSELLIAAKEMAATPATTFDKVALTAFALSYSLISALCVFHLRRYLPVMLFALLDGFAVYLRINVNQEPFLLLTALFFGIYTFCLISFCYLISKQNRKQNESTIAENEKQNKSTITENEKQNKSTITENENQNKNQNESDLLFVESKTETTIKQLVCKLNPMKSEEKRLEIIRNQPPEIQKQLLAKYHYTDTQVENQPQTTQPTLFSESSVN